MRRFIMWLFRIPSDQFRLDVRRVISIDGHEFYVESFSADGAFKDADHLVVEFTKFPPGSRWFTSG